MRLSFGLEHRQLQVQKLAPRMIQSMEILQLPLQELQERIEQELVENPVLELQERDPDAARRAGREREDPDEKNDRRQAAGRRRGPQQRRRLRAAAEPRPRVPEYFDETTRRSSNRMEEDAERAHDVMANVADRPESLQDYLVHQLGELELDRRPVADVRADHQHARSQGRRLLPGQPARPAAARRRRRSSCKLAEKALADRAVARSAGHRRPRPARVPAGAARRPTCPSTRSCKTLISNHLEDLRDNRLPLIQKVDRLLDRDDPGSLGRAAEAQSQAGRAVRRGVRAHRHARRVRRAGRRRQVQGASSMTAARRRCTSASTIASGWPAARRRPKSGSTSSGRSTPPSG